MKGFIKLIKQAPSWGLREWVGIIFILSPVLFPILLIVRDFCHK
jgi:hypothetical protein